MPGVGTGVDECVWAKAVFPPSLRGAGDLLSSSITLPFSPIINPLQLTTKDTKIVASGVLQEQGLLPTPTLQLLSLMKTQNYTPLITSV